MDLPLIVIEWKIRSTICWLPRGKELRHVVEGAASRRRTWLLSFILFSQSPFNQNSDGKFKAQLDQHVSKNVSGNVCDFQWVLILDHYGQRSGGLPWPSQEKEEEENKDKKVPLDEQETQPIADSAMAPLASPGVSPSQGQSQSLARAKSTCNLQGQLDAVADAGVEDGDDEETENPEEEPVTDDDLVVPIVIDYQDNETVQILSDDECVMSPVKMKAEGLAYGQALGDAEASPAPALESQRTGITDLMEGLVLSPPATVKKEPTEEPKPVTEKPVESEVQKEAAKEQEVKEEVKVKEDVQDVPKVEDKAENKVEDKTKEVKEEKTKDEVKEKTKEKVEEKTSEKVKEETAEDEVKEEKPKEKVEEKTKEKVKEEKPEDKVKEEKPKENVKEELSKEEKQIRIEEEENLISDDDDDPKDSEKKGSIKKVTKGTFQAEQTMVSGELLHYWVYVILYNIDRSMMCLHISDDILLYTFQYCTNNLITESITSFWSLSDTDRQFVICLYCRIESLWPRFQKCLQNCWRK